MRAATTAVRVLVARRGVVWCGSAPRGVARGVPVQGGMATTSMSEGGGAAPSPTAGDPAASGRIRVYTRTGDKGTSSLFTGERRLKDDAVFAALGDVDELNAHLGLLREHVAPTLPALAEQLVYVQSRCLDAGSAVATPLSTSSPGRTGRVAFPDGVPEQLERWIDAMDDTLPPLRNFILPSGGVAGAQAHVARTVCRRAERGVVSLVREGQVAPSVAMFLNRLSDYLFVTARYIAGQSGRVESVYKKDAGLTERVLEGKGKE